MAVAGTITATVPPLSALASAAPAPASPSSVRDAWKAAARRMATPLLTALAAGELRARMPVEAFNPKDRARFTHLEGFGRLLAGLAPWLELGEDNDDLASLARTGMDRATDPSSPDFMNFSDGRQPLVDAAFLAQAILRAPTALWARLEPRVQANVVRALISSRPIPPGVNNWVLFASMVEAMLHRVGAPRDDARLFAGLRDFQTWYMGDGWYGDGPEFHTDYYNAFVIQPMLIEVLDVVAAESAEWTDWQAKVAQRFTRFAAVQERLIAPDGSFPVLGRSIVYRGGAFQALALAAQRHVLPTEISPAQVRRALTAVLHRTLDAPGTYDDAGWLRLGLAGAQPSLAETYISTGSLYLCSTMLLPLGLPPSDPFWADADAPTTWEKAWSGIDLPADKALKGRA